MKNLSKRIAASCIASNKQIFDDQRDPARRSLLQAEQSVPGNIRPTDAERLKPPKLTVEVDAQYVLGYN